MALMKMKGRRASPIALLLAVLTVFSAAAGLCPDVRALDESLYTEYFNEHLDFEDLAADTEISAAYVNGKIDSDDLFTATPDGGGKYGSAYSPTQWKAVQDPKDPENTAIGLVDPQGYAMFQLLDKNRELFETPFVLGFRVMLHESVNTNTTLLGWRTGGDNSTRMRLIGISGNQLMYATDTVATSNTVTVDGGGVRLNYGQWYAFSVIIYPSSGRVQVEIDGKLEFDFVSATVRNAKPTESAMNLCYGWGSSFNFNVYLDDITLRSLDAKKIEAAEKQAAEEEASVRKDYVIEELEPYLKQFTYLKSDGKIGIPVGLTAYYKGDKSNSATSVVMYVMGYDGAREVGRGDTMSILNDLLDEGYIVVTVDYKDNPLATTPDIEWSLFGLRQKISSFVGGLTYARYEIYVVPDGYMLARNILFYDLAENARRGTIEKIIHIYNNDTKFRESKGSRIPNPNEKVTTIERCLKPDGTPIDLQLKLDIIYPVDSVEPAPVVMVASSIETRMQVCVADTNRPLDIGPLMRGCAVAIYDHIYTPMARNDHYGYFGGNFSLQDVTGVSYHAAAVRCVRYYADTFGYSKEDYAVMGLSKGSFCGVLANPHPEELGEHGTFSGYDGFETYGEQPFLCYDDGSPIPSGVTVNFRGMGQGDQWRGDYLTSECAPTLMAIGVLDNIVKIYNDWYNEHTDYELAGIDYLPITMTDMGHTFPAGIDPEYGYDRWALFMDFFMYYLTGEEVPRIVYTAAVDGKLVGDIRVYRENDSSGNYVSHNVVEDNQIFVQFIAPVTEESAKAGITLWDVTENKQVEVEYRKKGNGNRWYLDPVDGVFVGHTYELRVDASVASVLNGKTIGENAVFTFTV